MEFVRRLARVSQGQLAPLCAFFGGVAAQEAMKALTGSFTPLNQWLYMHCEPVIPSTSVTTRTNTDLHSRYGPLAICIGPENLQRLKNLSAFMVGCGAIGCELLKNLALLGVATGDRAAISQTKPMLDSNSQQTSVRQNVDTCGSSGPLHSPLSISQPNQGGAGDVTSGQFTPSCNSSTAQTLGSTSLNHHIPDGSTVLDDRQAGVSVTGITTLIVENDQVRTSRSGVLVDKASETQVANTEPISHHSAVSSTSHLSESHAASAEVCVKRPKADSKEATTSRVRETLAQSTKSFPLCGIETEVHNASGPSSASRANVNVSSLQADSRPLLLITDPDHIEKSNLNRQFLFHTKHIGLSKSAVAAEAARQMNSAMRITSMEEKVWPANEKTLFTDEFLLNLLSPKSHKSAESRVPSGIVLTALDCVPSRRYVDTRCVSLRLPLLESGTLGTKGHVQVILPGLTESYNSQRDDDVGPDAAESIPYCTLKSFPTLPIHCVEWAREKFASQFTLKPERLSQLLTVLDRSRPGRQLSVLCASLLRIPTANSDQLLNEAERETKARWLSGQLTCSLASFLASRPIDWYGCVRLARDKFERYFNHKARQLLHSFPPETRLADGTPFWQLPKRQPTPVEFRATDPLHQKFLMSYSRLLADQLTIAPTAGVDFNSSNAEDLAKHLDSCLQGYTPPVFVPSAKRIATDEDGTFEASVNNQNAEATTGGDPLNLDEHTIRALRTTLTALEDAVKLRSIYACHSVAFEKDDDRLAHVDFIASAANLRAVMYGLPVTPRHEVRRIAGRIVPAIATTTAAIAGLVCLELVKYACRTPTSDSLNPTTHASRNAFLNLALPVIILSEPAPCPRIRLPNQSEFTLWDRWTVEPSKSLDIYTLEDFVLDLKIHYSP
ncbi:hypothetical protein CRM22_010655 [Opisthorchis felineus]|uniref:Ubiquitin-activating enzyme E1 C-terminal domain-containing protein n=1 Tax=Opisthorchis felineus TaxID=147828 RepID=A0A4S2KR54_OPIFE|nr:hypothetical protein CRM22_010655 [Opisthorchis felineus]